MKCWIGWKMVTATGTVWESVPGTASGEKSGDTMANREVFYQPSGICSKKTAIVIVFANRPQIIPIPKKFRSPHWGIVFDSGLNLPTPNAIKASPSRRTDDTIGLKDRNFAARLPPPPGYRFQKPHRPFPGKIRSRSGAVARPKPPFLASRGATMANLLTQRYPLPPPIYFYRHKCRVRSSIEESVAGKRRVQVLVSTIPLGVSPAASLKSHDGICGGSIRTRHSRHPNSIPRSFKAAWSSDTSAP